MKKLFLPLLTITILSASQNIPADLGWIETQIKDIKKTRKGIDPIAISHLQSTFIFLEKNRSKKRKSTAVVPTTPAVSTTHTTRKHRYKRSKKRVKTAYLKVNAIMNHSALIGNRWYKEGDKLYGYTISKITLQDVILVRGNKKRILSTNSNRMPR